MSWNYDKAIDSVKKAVKESHLPGQKHIDLSVINAPDRAVTQSALAYLQSLIIKGEIEESKLKKDLGII